MTFETSGPVEENWRDAISSIEEIIEDARNGRMFILVDHEDRENEGDLVIPAQMATPEAINFMATHGRGLICLTLTSDRVDALGLQLMASQNSSRHETAFTISIEAREGVTTGISAHDRARTVAVAIDSGKGAAEIATPGHVFPLRAKDGGVLVRAGHTEAAVDVSRLAGLNPSGVICEIMNDDGSMSRLPDLVAFAQKHALKIGTISDLIAYRRRHDNLVAVSKSSTVTSEFGGEWEMRIYTDETHGAEHIALIKGDIATDEPVLVVETARHGLLTEDFVRNTSPDLISAEQGGFPIAFRDSDIFVELNDAVPEALHDGTALILRTDRRLGFDPTAEWLLRIKALRAHGSFQPEIGFTNIETTHITPARFYSRIEPVKPTPPWLDALRNRQADLIVLGVFLVGLVALLGLQLNRLAGHRYFTPIRLGILAFVVGFVGWWGQGQLSIATPLAVGRTALDGGSYAFLLYDPFSLAVWGVTILGFGLRGRGLFCGWLCPFGALQEFAHHLGRLLRLPQIEVPAAWDDRLKWLKYGVLAALVLLLFTAPARLDKAIEVEPFKTAISTFFIREWYYVAYAVGLLLVSMVLFKGFCRYVCPLGAVMAIGGVLRGRKWIERRTECGSPCQLCKVKCSYGAIKKTGEIQYSECFQCLDCVTIHDDRAQCVPLILAAKGRKIGLAAE